MNRLGMIVVALVAGVAGAGCASMSAQECVTADWRAVGFEDGVRGHTADAVARHRKACAKAGVTADQQAYEAGRQAGLEEFCRPARGVCPVELERDFLRAYEDGRRFYDLERGVRDTEQALNRIERELQVARDELVAGEERLIEGGGTSAERARIVEANRDIATQIGQMENERANLLVELGERRAALRDYSVSNY
jgi:hypothetical protein